MNTIHVLNKATARKIQRVVGVVALFAMVFAFTPVPLAHATQLTTMKDTLSTVKASTAANHTITFVTPTGVSAGQTIVVTFPTSFDLSTIVIGDVDLDSAVLAATPSGATWGWTLVGQVMTFTSGTGTYAGAATVTILVGTNTSVGGAGTHQVVNPTAGNDKVMSITAGSGADSGSLAISIIANDVVNITSNVDPTLTFTVSDTTIGFGTLAVANARYATGDTSGSASDAASAHDLTIATNTTAGYAITYNGATLTSGGNTISVATIAADANGTPGSEQFALSATTDGAGTIASGYAHTGPDWKFVAGSAQTLISKASAVAGTETVGVRYLANVASTSEPGAYQTNLTYVGTATF